MLKWQGETQLFDTHSAMRVFDKLVLMEMFTKLPTEIAYVVLAAAGGVSRYLFIYINEGSFAWRHFIAHTFISCFSGYMFYLFGANVLGVSEGGVAIIAGMGGWMGVEALKLLESFIRSKFKTK